MLAPRTLCALCAVAGVLADDPRWPVRQHTFVLTDFGAVGDGVTLNTGAFERAVAAVAAAGEGELRVPADGVFLTAPFNLTSHMTLHLERNATILGATDFALWPVLQPLPSYGRGRDYPTQGHYTSLVHGEGLADVAIVGANGTIDGQGAAWWAAKEADDAADELWRRRQQQHGQGQGPPPPPVSHQLNYTRGHLVELLHSEDVLIDNVTLRNSPFWTVHPAYCDRVTARRLTILNPPHSPNTDGFDPDSSSNVLLEDAYFAVGDDGVAIKSGWDCFGTARCGVGRPAENITIRNLVVRSPTSAGLCLGSEMSGGIRNVTLDGATFVGVSTGLRIKTARERGGFVEDVTARNVVLHGVHTAIQVNAFYGGENSRCAEPARAACQNATLPPVVARISVSNWTGDGVVQAADLEGLADAPTTAISVRDVHLEPAILGWKCSAVSGTAAGTVKPKPCAELVPV